MKRIPQVFTAIFVGGALLFTSCQKSMENEHVSTDLVSVVSTGKPGHLKQTKTFSSDVVVSWIDMQLAMLKLPLPAGTGTQGTDRSQAYTGIALYESVMPGMPAYKSLSGQLTNFPAMPTTQPGMAYNWGASANAAMAAISRGLFPTTADANKVAMTNLENQWNAAYAADADAATMARSIAFGKEVAARVLGWAATDGSANVNPPYVPPVGIGLWVPTAPAPAINPYASQRRLLVPTSAYGTTLEPLPPFSTDPSSAFYAMVKEVYDISFKSSPDQKAMALYFRDNPGYGPGGGFVWILGEALRLSKFPLDSAALTYAKVGMALNDATIVLFTNKYHFNVIRPVTYINRYIDPNWKTFIGTPNHPEFPSGHATTNGAVLTMMSNMFGENFPITLHTYDYLGFAPRTYTTFTQMGLDMANSRIYGGLHYRPTCEKSIVQGKQVAQNILSTIAFLK
jgi:hypothetical protein